MGGLLLALCIETIAVVHTASPLSEMRRLGLPAGDFPRQFAAAPVQPPMRPLGNFGGLLWVDGQRVVADAALVSDLQVVDATTLPAGQRAVAGKLAAAWKARPAHAVRVLLEAGVIRTYWHLESTVCLEEVADKEAVWEGRYSGTHIYFTNAKNTGKFAFLVRVERDGTVAVTGR